MTGMDDDPRLALLFALADDELILGHRHSEWTGWAPHIEEDLAFSSIAQDEMAHARLLYGLAGPMTGRDEYSLALALLYDTADAVRLEALADSSWGELAELIAVIRLEEKYHLDHAKAWFERLANGPQTARQKLAEGLVAAVGEAVELFEPLPGERDLVT